LRIWWPNIISNKDLWKVRGQEDTNLEKEKENLVGLVTHKEKRISDTKGGPTLEPPGK